MNMDEYDDRKDDEDASEPQCPYCGSTGDCPHLVGLMDRSFLSIEEGYLYDGMEEISREIETKLKTILQQTADIPETGWEHLDHIIGYAAAHYDPDSAEEQDANFEGLIDNDVLYDLVIEHVEANGHIEVFSIEGPPGFTSSEWFLWAKNPQETINVLIAKIEHCIKEIENNIYAT